MIQENSGTIARKEDKEIYLCTNEHKNVCNNVITNQWRNNILLTDVVSKFAVLRKIRPDPYLKQYTKMNSRWIQDIYVKNRIIKLIEKNLCRWIPRNEEAFITQSFKGTNHKAKKLILLNQNWGILFNK